MQAHHVPTKYPTVNSTVSSNVISGSNHVTTTENIVTCVAIRKNLFESNVFIYNPSKLKIGAHRFALAVIQSSLLITVPNSDLDLTVGAPKTTSGLPLSLSITI